MIFQKILLKLVDSWQLQWKNFVTVLVLVGAFFNFVPVLLGKSLKRDGEYPSHLKDLNGSVFEGSLIASIISCLPILIDYCIDVLVRQKQHSSFEELIPRRELFLAFLIPDLFILFYVLPYEKYDLLPGLIGSRDTLYTCAFLSYLGTVEPAIWKFYLLGLIAISLSASNVIESFRVVTIDHNLASIQLRVMVVLVGSAFILLCYCCYKWKNYVKSVRDMSKRTRLNVYNTYILFFVAFTMIDWFPILSYELAENPHWNIFYGDIYLTNYMYITAGCTIMVLVMSTRLARLEIAETKQMFIRYISHEVRTPMNTIFLGLKLLENDLEHNDIDTCLEVVNDLKISANVALSTLNDMLMFDKILTNSLQLEMEHLSPWPLIRDAIAPMLIQARVAEIDVIDVAANMIQSLNNYLIFADASKLSQVVRNLFSNAMKFTGSGQSVQLVVEPYFEESKSRSLMSTMSASIHGRTTGNSSPISPIDRVYNRLRIQVIDTGVGISEENQARLFHEIIQFNPGKLQNGGGSGVGLFITKRILDAHNGTISVWSAGEGHGTTFTVTLPLLRKTSVHGRKESLQFSSFHERLTLSEPRRAEPWKLSNVAQPHTFADADAMLRSLDVQSFQQGRPNNPQLLPISGKSSHDEFMTKMTANPAIQQSNASIGQTSSSRRPENDSHTSKQSKGSGGNCNVGMGRAGRYSRRRSSGLSFESTSSSSSLLAERITHSDNQHEFDESKQVDRIRSYRSSKSNYVNNLSSKIITTEPPAAWSSVLIVDDSAMNRKMMKRTFDRKFRSCVEAVDGLNAVNIVKEMMGAGKTFDLILMDYQMPNMDGPTATKTLRDIGYTGAIIGVTGNVLTKDVTTFRSHGVNEVLSKPLEVSDIDKFMRESRSKP